MFLGMDVGGRGAVIQLSDGSYHTPCPAVPVWARYACPPFKLPPALRHPTKYRVHAHNRSRGGIQISLSRPHMPARCQPAVHHRKQPHTSATLVQGSFGTLETSWAHRGEGCNFYDHSTLQFACTRHEIGSSSLQRWFQASVSLTSCLLS